MYIVYGDLGRLKSYYGNVTMAQNEIVDECS